MLMFKTKQNKTKIILYFHSLLTHKPLLETLKTQSIMEKEKQFD